MLSPTATPHSALTLAPRALPRPAPQLAERERALQERERQAKQQPAPQQPPPAQEPPAPPQQPGPPPPPPDGPPLEELQQRVRDLEKDLFEQKNATVAEEKAKKSALATVRDTQYELRQLENEFSTLKIQNIDLKDQMRRQAEEAQQYK